MAGRPLSAVTQKIKDEVCTRLAGGESLRTICADAHMPNRSEVFTALYADEQFANQYARARKFWALAEFENMLDIADTPEQGEKTVVDDEGTQTTYADMIEHRKLQVNTRQWGLARMNKTIFGEKIEINNTTPADSMTPEEIADRMNKIMLEAAKRKANGKKPISKPVQSKPVDPYDASDIA